MLRGVFEKSDGRYNLIYNVTGIKFAQECLGDHGGHDPFESVFKSSSGASLDILCHWYDTIYNRVEGLFHASGVGLQEEEEEGGEEEADEEEEEEEEAEDCSSDSERKTDPFASATIGSDEHIKFVVDSCYVFGDEVVDQRARVIFGPGLFARFDCMSEVRERMDELLVLHPLLA
jgi:hypothetical protein